jgi:hypothetical protein
VNVSGILGLVYDSLAILEATSEFLRLDLDEAMRVRKSKFNKSMAMRKAKMRFGPKKKSSTNLTMAQKKQRQTAALASARKRTGRKVSKRKIQWR